MKVPQDKFGNLQLLTNGWGGHYTVVTQELIALATVQLGTKPLFWGRYVKGPIPSVSGTSSDGEGPEYGAGSCMHYHILSRPKSSRSILQ